MAAQTYIQPDFFTNCLYKLRVNPATDSVSHKTEQWILKEADYDEEKQASFLKIRGGLLAGYCSPSTDAFHLQVVSDFIGWIFCVDDLTDEYTRNEADSLHGVIMTSFRHPGECEDILPACRLAKDFFCRFQQSAGPRCTKRFINAIDLFVKGVIQQAGDRDNDNIPDLQTYIALRRDTSGMRPCIALTEFAAGIDIPDDVIAHPLIRAMEDAVNDWGSWTNDIFSYNKEQSVGDTHNFVIVLMKERNLDLQSAMDLAGELCLACITTFETNRKALPSWGSEVDHQVGIYVQGLQDWIVGSLHWSFDSRRYFGSEGAIVKHQRVVQLSPRRNIGPSSSRAAMWYVAQIRS